MGIDIKFPIGLMFTILGVILTIFGIVTTGNDDMYTRSLGININLWSGCGMLLFGLIMLYLALRDRKSKTT
jgi:protein-S-isoprenylcysteine O-methyltransferase Ste14